MERLIKIGQFVRILDGYGEISLSNIAFMIMIYKMLFIAVPSWQDAVAFLTAMYGYQEKRKTEP